MSRRTRVPLGFLGLLVAACSAPGETVDAAPGDRPTPFEYTLVHSGSTTRCSDWPAVEHPHPTVDPLPPGGPFVVWEYEPEADPLVARPALPRETHVEGLSIGGRGDLWAIAPSRGELIAVGRSGSARFYRPMWDATATQVLAQWTRPAPDGSVFFLSTGDVEHTNYYVTDGLELTAVTVGPAGVDGYVPGPRGFVIGETGGPESTTVGLCRGTREDWRLRAEANGAPVALHVEVLPDGTLFAAGDHLPGVLHLSSAFEIIGTIGMDAPVPERLVPGGGGIGPHYGDLMLLGGPPIAGDQVYRLFRGAELLWSLRSRVVTEGRYAAVRLDPTGGLWESFRWDPPYAFLRRYDASGRALFSLPDAPCEVVPGSAVLAADGSLICARVSGPDATGNLLRVSPTDGSVLWELEVIPPGEGVLGPLVGPDVDGRVYAVVYRRAASLPHIVAVQTDALRP